MIKFTFKGFNRVANPLRKIAALNERDLDPIVGEWAKTTRNTLKGTSYPPQRAGQTYVRTGNLANRWAAQRTGAARWAIANTAPYAQYVVSDDQAWMHKGRWWMASSEIAKYTPKLTSALTRELSRKIRNEF